MSDQIERYSDPELAAAMARVELVAYVMDGMFELPGTRTRFGLDAIIGLVPIIGDLISQAISSYILWEARQIGVSRWTFTRMATNSAIDTIVGMVPFIGDAFDVAFRANRKNLELLRAHLAKNGHNRKSGVADDVIDVTATRVSD